MTKQGPWHGATWEVGYQHLQAWVSEHGDANIPVDYVCDDSFRLGRWVNTQRVARRNGRLNQDRVALLEAVGLVWDPTEVKKGNIFKALEEYVLEHGNGDVPSSHKTSSGIALGNWVRRQRALMAHGRCPEDVMALFGRLGLTAARGPAWSWSDARIIEALQSAATFAFPLTQLEYERLVDSDAVEGPSRATILKRFGSWQTACAEAGVEH